MDTKNHPILHGRYSKNSTEYYIQCIIKNINSDINVSDETKVQLEVLCRRWVDLKCDIKMLYLDFLEDDNYDSLEKHLEL